MSDRFRLPFKFWLDVNKPDEQALVELIEDLKVHKLYTATVRDGIRLVDDLRNGRLDVLFTLYPWVRELVSYGQGGALHPPAPAIHYAPSGEEMPLTITHSSGEDAADNFLDSLDSLEF